MGFAKRLISLLKDPSFIWRYFSRKGCLKWLNDETYIKHIYKIKFKKKLNLNNPVTFNEKLQWLKLNDRSFLYTIMVDKIKVKDYVSSFIGEDYIIPTLGVWRDAREIDFDNLPSKFVLKCNHDSSSIVFCRDKANFNKKKAIKKLNKFLKANGYNYGREWPYKNVEKRIFAEPLLEDNDFKDKSLNVYKFLCFSGKPIIIQTIQNDKTPEEVIDYFDDDWNLLNLRQNFPNSQKPLTRPKTLDKMLDISSKLSKGFPFLRVDLYEVNGKIYFSEFTFYSDDGMNKFVPEDWDFKLGELIDIEESERRRCL